MRFLLLVGILGIAGCRLAGTGASPAASPSASPSASSAPVGVEAPEACAFPPGTALSYAGRSTTAALDVQEVVGDPMSDDLADIYITRDRFRWGQLHGRLVCAVFVHDPNFVEVTVHPADGGRISLVPTTPSISPSPLPSGSIAIVTHCGLDFVRIEYEGQLWRFDVEEHANPPDGWGFNTTVVQLRPGPDGPIVVGPDGAEWQLIPAGPPSSPSICF